MRKNLTVRLDDDVYNELDTLCEMFSVSKNELIVNLIRNEYHKYKEDPKIALVLKQAADLQETLKKYQKELDAAGLKK